jgi:hypothetical protein
MQIANKKTLQGTAGRGREIMIHYNNMQLSDVAHLPERIKNSSITDHYEKKITTTGSR